MKTNVFLGKQHQMLTLPPWPQELVIQPLGLDPFGNATTHDMRTTHHTAIATDDSRGHLLGTGLLACPPKMVLGDTEVVDMGSTSHAIPTHGESGHDKLVAAGAAHHNALTTWVTGSGTSTGPWGPGGVLGAALTACLTSIVTSEKCFASGSE